MATSRGIRAELYKLNVYSGPSGMFKPHVDTPKSEVQIGSLVVSLPVPFEGGALAVRHGGKEVLHDWSDTGNGRLPAIHWAAFYSDCEHEVLPVTSGTRLTLTYNLYLSAGTGILAGRPLSLNPRQLSLFAFLGGMLKNANFMRQGGVLGIHLSHSYPHTNGKLLHLVPRMLKGVDLVLYESLYATGLYCMLGAIESSSRLPPDLLEIIACTAKYATPCMRTGPSHVIPVDLSETKVTEIEECDPEGDSSSDGAGDYDSDDSDAPYGGEKGQYWKDVRKVARDITWLNGTVHREMSAALMTYGNQAELKVRYSSAALFVSVPSWLVRLSGDGR